MRDHNPPIVQGSNVPPKTRAWRHFFALTKPRMVLVNVWMTFGGYMVAAHGHLLTMVFLYTLLGAALVMASACVFNNVMDQRYDALMVRTRLRAIPQGDVTTFHALFLGSVLGIVGFSVLYFGVHPLATLVAAIGFATYVGIYTAWLKRTSTWSTSVGGIAGAVPPVIGYCAVTHSVDAGAWLLFAWLFLWQPPHFWALAIAKRDEYAQAGYPLLPVVKGNKRTKIQMLPYVVALFPVVVLLFTQYYAGMLFLYGACALLIGWLLLCIRGFFVDDEKRWAMTTFRYSLIVLMMMLILLIIDTPRLGA